MSQKISDYEFEGIKEKAIRDFKKAFTQFPQRFTRLENTFKTYNQRYDERDKDFLYQELLYLERTRDSLQENQKETKDPLQKKEVEEKLLDLSLKVMYLRVIIALYGKSQKCELVMKELLEK